MAAAPKTETPSPPVTVAPDPVQPAVDYRSAGGEHRVTEIKARTFPIYNDPEPEVDIPDFLVEDRLPNDDEMRSLRQEEFGDVDPIDDERDFVDDDFVEDADDFVDEGRTQSEPAKRPLSRAEQILEKAQQASGLDLDQLEQHFTAALEDPEAYAPQPDFNEELAAEVEGDARWQRAVWIRDNPEYSDEAREMASMTAENREELIQLRLESRQDRVARERDSQSRAQTEAIEALARTAKFKDVLKTAADRQAVIRFARKEGIANLEIAAKAMHYDGVFTRGRTTSERARTAGTTPSSRVTPGREGEFRGRGTSSDPMNIPPEVAKGGMSAMWDHLIRRTPDLLSTPKGRRRR